MTIREAYFQQMGELTLPYAQYKNGRPWKWAQNLASHMLVLYTLPCVRSSYVAPPREKCLTMSPHIAKVENEVWQLKTRVRRCKNDTFKQRL